MAAPQKQPLTAPPTKTSHGVIRRASVCFLDNLLLINSTY